MLLACVAPAIAADQRPPVDKVAEARRIGAYYQHRYGFNGEIVLAHGDAILSDETYGLAHIELPVALTPGMRFAIGSFTKQFTAAAILWLQDHGKLRVTDRIAGFLPKPLPATWANITIEQLLVHSSGIPDDVLMDDYPQFRIDPHSPEELIRAVQDKPLKFAPGSRYDYTNIEYVILGAIVEKAGGESWAEFIKGHFLNPLHLQDTGIGGTPQVIERHVSGYVTSHGALTKAVTADPSVLGAAGSMYSTGADLARWVAALQGGKVLHAATLKAMDTPRIETAGYGAFIETLSGAPVIGHGGDLPGFHTQVYFFPGSGDTVVVLSNISRSRPLESPGTYGVTNELLELEADPNGIRPSTGRVASVERASLDALGGTYAMEGSSTSLGITTDGDGLVLATPGQPPVHLKPETKDKFYAAEQNMEVEFGEGTMTLYNYTYEQRTVWARSKAAPGP
ncbi:hypothetical protein VI08_06845 [Luteibacter yeojuensis]|uniref:Beta-lactamase-related domain-containing protein n=2 Tax=Luteibacter yeojuensis TaxID=345309 RepID=A0A0F3L027_9GAMM|nr:hypothetical protein VI08_06845 [Luteibacter yeojuensis]